MSSSDSSPVLIAGEWRAAHAAGSFQAFNPRTEAPTGPPYPVSSREDLDLALASGAEAAKQLLQVSPERIARFLEEYADRIEAEKEELVDTAHGETALARTPRLAEVELPRTTAQLRQAAAAARDRSWTMPTIDTAADLRCMYGPLGGPVAVFGPNNFPFAFNSAAGGDFAAAVAAGNPVIAKANPGHPRTTELLARIAFESIREIGLPPGTLQLIYQIAFQDGEWFVSHPRIGATAFTGSRHAGLVLKAAAEQAGKLFYMETGSVNPVVILPGALEERLEKIVQELTASCLLAGGQFCTQPGLVILLAGDRTEEFVRAMARSFDEAPIGTLLGAGVRDNLESAVMVLTRAGAERVTGGSPGGGEGYSFRNTLLRVDGGRFLYDPESFQREAFGNETLLVIAKDVPQLTDLLETLGGNLTGSVYSSRDETDDALYAEVARILRRKVGRLLNDQMPTGVTVSPAMHHGGPYPASSHPGFTAIGIPPALLRFAALHCYDHVRESRLPPELQNRNPTKTVWRRIDDEWTRDDVARR